MINDIKIEAVACRHMFELEPTPAVLAVQAEYMRLAASLWLGTDPLPAVPMKDRDIFDLLGFD